MHKFLWTAALVLFGCATVAAPPGSQQVGEWVVLYRGPELELAVGYRFAAAHVGDDWLFLDVVMTAPFGQVVEVSREGIWLESPLGEVVPLASQGEFAAAYSQLLPRLRRAAIAADPLDYFPRQELCALGFFAAPGEGLAYPTVFLNDRRACAGKLFFHVPFGIQGGRWVLVVKAGEKEVRVPLSFPR